jgi:hypothetical protein
LHIAEVNLSARTVSLSGENVHYGQEEGARYWIENSFDALDSPGEWYLNRRSGTLYYWPMPGEDMKRAEVIAPLLTELVRFRGGTWGDGRPGGFAFAFNPVHDIRLQGLTLSYADWSMPTDGYTDVQGGFSLPAAVEASDATSIVIESSVFKHLGPFAIELGKACRGNRMAGNEMADLGAGAVKIGEPKDPNTDDEVTSGNIVSDNRIHDVGVVDAGADAVWVGQSSGNTIAHNEISNVYHSGIAVGWTWGYLPYGQDNIVRNNIFALGKTSQLRRTDEEPGHSFDFEHNIVMWESGSLLDEEWKDNNFHFDNNLYFYNGNGGSSAIRFGDLSFEEWQKRGQDLHSVIADPLFVDLQKGDFSLKPQSPALKIGFKAIDLSEVGRRVNYGRQQ